MNKKAWLIFLCIQLCLILTMAGAQSAQSRLDHGKTLYGEGKWRDAVLELRRAQAEAQNNTQRGEALYWIALAEIGAGEYEAALRDLEETLRIDSTNSRVREVPYQQGRCLYYMGQYDRAIVLLKGYADANTDPSKIAASYYWIGECLFSLGQLQMAQDVFYRIVDEFPQSVKYEAANYRIALINQKKVEAELLAILKWSHEESLKTVEAYQRRERSYDQAIIAYQKRIADLLKAQEEKK